MNKIYDKNSEDILVKRCSPKYLRHLQRHDSSWCCKLEDYM